MRVALPLHVSYCRMVDTPGGAGGVYTIDEFEEYDLMGNNSDEEDQHAPVREGFSGTKSICREDNSGGIEEVIVQTKRRSGITGANTLNLFACRLNLVTTRTVVFASALLANVSYFFLNRTQLTYLHLV